MVLNPARNCRIFLFERDVFHGPHAWLCAIFWNRVEDIEQRAPAEGELYFMDAVAFRWNWSKRRKS